MDESAERGFGDLANEFTSLNHHVIGGLSRGEAMQRLVNQAVAAVTGCDWAAITEWPESAKPRTLASSGDVASQVDRMQYATGEGPCLTAAHSQSDAGTPPGWSNDPVTVEDLRTETRWPAFVEAVREQTPVRAIISFPLLHQPVRSALNLYSAQPGGFDHHAIVRAGVFVEHARALMLHAESSNKAANLELALESSRLIGTAVGILMRGHGVTSDQAFNLLRTASQNLNRKLRDIADEVAFTGELPPTARTARPALEQTPAVTTSSGPDPARGSEGKGWTMAGPTTEADHIVQAHGPDEVEQLLSRTYANMRFTGLAPSSAAATLRSRSLGRLRLDRVTIDADFTVEIAPPEALMFLHPRAGHVHDVPTGRSYDAADVHFGVQPDETAHLSYRHLTAAAIVAPAGSIETVCGHQTGIRSPVFHSRAVASKDDTPRFERLFSYLWAVAAESHSALTEAAAEQLLIATMLDILPTNLPGEPQLSDGRDAHPAALRRALSFIDEHVDQPIGPADIANAAGISVRALQQAFRQHLHTTPTAHLTQVRLHHAHADLTREHPSTTSVRAVAEQWGFARPAAFINAYRHTFGKHPDQTLAG